MKNRNVKHVCGMVSSLDYNELKKLVVELEEDKKRIDFLESLLERAKYTGRVILRNSTMGRGWRLHETSLPDASQTVREAIDIGIKEGI